MKLFVIYPQDSWGTYISVVRAMSAERAQEIVNTDHRDLPKRTGDVSELVLDGPEELLFQFEYCPDSY